MNEIDNARKKRRQKTGWTIEEIKEKARQEREAFKKLNECEPDALASGKGMEKIAEEADDEKED